MGNGYKWNVGALNDAHTWPHTTHKKQIVELAIASPTTNIMLGTNCNSIGHQNGPTLHKHAT